MLFRSQYLSARRIDTGAALWTSSVDIQAALSAPALGESTIVIGTGTGDIRAFSTRTGTQRWTFTTGNAVTSTRPYVRTSGDIVASPVISGSTVFAASTNGKLYAIDLVTGVSNWSLDVGVQIGRAHV